MKSIFLLLFLFFYEGVFNACGYCWTFNCNAKRTQYVGICLCVCVCVYECVKSVIGNNLNLAPLKSSSSSYSICFLMFLFLFFWIFFNSLSFFFVCFFFLVSVFVVLFVLYLSKAYQTSHPCIFLITFSFFFFYLFTF